VRRARPVEGGGRRLLTLPTLEGARVRLRSLTADDAPAILEIFGDPRVTLYMGLGPRASEAEALALIDEIHDLGRRDVLYQWGIAGRADDRVLGTVTLAHLDLRNRRAELGFALGTASWGRGLATEAVRLALDRAFTGMALHRVEADVDPRNARSLALLERLGFRREGYLPERWLTAEGWQDSVPPFSPPPRE
jgi:RimJ/RimL family protein N-acetyltransferase